MNLLAPAKINLHLRVGPPRADGFHPLLTWMCTVGLFDELTLTPHEHLEFTCDDPALPTNSDNLAVKAAQALQVKVKIHLAKRIPAGGGLAGGSSDAARTLLGVNRLCGLGHSTEQLIGIAARLGSDVAFFLRGRSSICTGVGEIVATAPLPAARWVLLIFPPFPMATPAVYRRFDELNPPESTSLAVPPDWAKWARMPARELMANLVNDLEDPAFDLNPALGKLRAEWERRLQRPVRMSGSGSTLFTLYDIESNAQAANAAAPDSTRVVPLCPPIRDELS